MRFDSYVRQESIEKHENDELSASIAIIVTNSIRTGTLRLGNDEAVLAQPQPAAVVDSRRWRWRFSVRMYSLLLFSSERWVYLIWIRRKTNWEQTEQQRYEQSAVTVGQHACACTDEKFLLTLTWTRELASFSWPAWCALGLVLWNRSCRSYLSNVKCVDHMGNFIVYTPIWYDELQLSGQIYEFVSRLLLVATVVVRVVLIESLYGLRRTLSDNNTIQVQIVDILSLSH